MCALYISKFQIIILLNSKLNYLLLPEVGSLILVFMELSLYI